MSTGNLILDIFIIFNLFLIGSWSIPIYIIDGLLNFLINTNFLLKIGVWIVFLILFYKFLEFGFKFLNQKKSIIKKIELTPENDDKPIDFDEFAEIYKDSGGFTNLLDDLNTISKLIISSPSSNSTARTICIDGKWGSGKTSYINILKDFNEEKLGNIPIPTDNITINSKINKNELIWVDDFQPWNFGNSSEMMTEFFKVLTDKTAEAGLYTLPWNSWKYNDYANLASTALEEKPFLKTAFQLLFPQKNMPELKKEICKDLKQLTKKIVFVLDDIDREDPKMVLEVMRLVKSVADFPNLIFILPFDYNKVSAIITKEYGEAYQNYLQKIVNNTCPIDNYSYEDLESIFSYEFRNCNQCLIDILPQIYEYYRIQVWLIGFRQRVDWLVSKGMLIYENGYYKIQNSKYSKEIHVSNGINILDTKVKFNKFRLSDIKLESNEIISEHNAALDNAVNDLINHLYKDHWSFNIIAYIDRMNLERFQNQLNNCKKFLRLIVKEKKLKHNKSEQINKIKIKFYLKEFDNYLVTVDVIKDDMQEFAPSPREIKAFARKILTKSMYMKEINGMLSRTTAELDYIILKQNYNFQPFNENLPFRPRDSDNLETQLDKF